MMYRPHFPFMIAQRFRRDVSRKYRSILVNFRFSVRETFSAVFIFLLVASVILFVRSQAPAKEQEKAAKKPRPLTILLDDAPSVDQTGFFVAKELGIYQKAGLPDIEFRWNEGNENPFELFTRDKIDFAVFWMAEGIVARSKQIPITAIALLAHGTGACFLTRNDLHPNILELRSLQHRKISLWGCCSFTPKAFLLEKGISGQFIKQRTNASMLFSSGGADVMFSTLYDVAVLYKYLEFRESLRLFVFSSQGCTYPETTLFCRDQLLNTDPELCRKFTMATYEGWQRAFADPHIAIRILLRYCKYGGMYQDEFILREQFDEYKSVMQFQMPIEANGNCEKERFDILCNDLVKTKLIESSKCPSFDVFFKYILDEKTFEKLVEAKTADSSGETISQKRKTE